MATNRNENEDVKELERRAADEPGRDPTARRGEIEEGGSLSDEDVGKDEIQRKAVGGYGGDTGESVRSGTQKPLTDNSQQKRGEPEGEE